MSGYPAGKAARAEPTANNCSVTALAGCLLVSSGLVPGVLLVVWALTDEARSAGPAAPEAALTLAAAATCLALVSWLCVSLSLALLECLPGRAGRAAGRLAERVTPAAARRWVAFLLGLSLGAPLTPGSAVASPEPALGTSPSIRSRIGPGRPDGTVPGPQWSPSPRRQSPSPSSFSWRVTPPPAGTAPPNGSPPGDGGGNRGPGWTPSRPTIRPIPTPDLLTSIRDEPTPDREGVVVVRRGDTLWDIAARYLGRDTTDSAVAAEWPRWFDANRDVIGDDPDLILPGQRLRPPLAS